jgi:hypothetical protein
MRAEACQAPEDQMLTLGGDKADSASQPIHFKTTLTPLEGGWARLEGFAGKGYGQTITW